MSWRALIHCDHAGCHVFDATNFGATGALAPLWHGRGWDVSVPADDAMRARHGVTDDSTHLDLCPDHRENHYDRA